MDGEQDVPDASRTLASVPLDIAPVKPTQAVQEELAKVLEADDSRLGQVYRLRKENLDPDAIASRLGVPTSRFVWNNERIAKALLEGNLPTAATVAGRTASVFRTILGSHQLAPAVRSYLQTNLVELERRSSQSVLSGFTDPVSFTSEAVAAAPAAPGVHLVTDSEDTVLYVGQTGNLRERLRQHLQGDRAASVLHEQVGELLDADGHSASAKEIQDWLGQCTVCWKLADDPQALKAELVAALTPRFNRAAEFPPTGVWWVNQGVNFDDERRVGIVFAGSRAPRVSHHVNVSRMQPGDIVLHYRRGELVALGEVATDAEHTQRPYGPAAERDEGWQTRVEYFPLHAPIPLAQLPERDGDEGPFGRTGAVKQGYLFAVEKDYAEVLRTAFADRWPPGSPWSGSERRFWLFQANPRQWDLSGHLPEMPPGTVDDWIVTRHRAGMHPGDGVVLWQGGPKNAGVYALARLVGFPRMEPTADFRPESVGEQEYKVDLMVERHVQPPITRAQVQADPVLSGLDVLRRPWGGTNLAMTREQWRAVLALTPLERHMDELGELVEQFRAETRYTEDVRAVRDGERGELAAALTGEGLDDPDVRLLRRLAGPAYGSPGPQPGFNRLLQTEDDIARVIDTLRYLLYGPGDVEGRLDACIRGEFKLTAVGEAMMVKALAVSDPQRWVPCNVTTGKVGKLTILGLLGVEPPTGMAPGMMAAATNDLIRQRLEPYLPGDPWGMQEFTWWLLHRERVPESPLSALADELYLSEEFLARIMALLDDKGQVVFYGPPGTGKTFVARKLAGYIARGGGTVEKVQFHPSYAYEDFVEGYRPRLVDGQVTYEVADGPLKRIAATALERPDLTHVLLIDELNRANVSKVLGELLFLLEYREEEIRLQYSDAPFALPVNLQIIATMNTADRSIALVDTALRRRFHFVPFFPDTEPIRSLLRRWLADNQPELAWVAEVVDRANAALADRNVAIGPSHFLRPRLTEAVVRLAWENSVLPFLEEHFFADPDHLTRFDFDRLRASAADAQLLAGDAESARPPGPADGES